MTAMIVFGGQVIGEHKGEKYSTTTRLPVPGIRFTVLNPPCVAAFHVYSVMRRALTDRYP